MFSRYQHYILLLSIIILFVDSLDFGFFRKIGASFSSPLTRATAMSASKYPIYCEEAVMSKKAHGTCDKPVMKNLKWGCDWNTADRICCFNRHYAEHSGYWLETKFLQEVDKEGITTYYDSVSGKPLFRAPINRTFDEFMKESKSHGNFFVIVISHLKFIIIIIIQYKDGHHSEMMK